MDCLKCHRLWPHLNHQLGFAEGLGLEWDPAYCLSLGGLRSSSVVFPCFIFPVGSVRSFKQLRLTASDCEVLRQSPEGTAALTQPLSQRPGSQDSCRRLGPTPRRRRRRQPSKGVMSCDPLRCVARLRKCFLEKIRINGFGGPLPRLLMPWLKTTKAGLCRCDASYGGCVAAVRCCVCPLLLEFGSLFI